MAESIAARVLTEHRWINAGCTCRAITTRLYDHEFDRWLAAHEQQLREHIAAELDEWAREHEVMDMPGPYGSGARYALAAAKEITKGDAR